MAYTKRLSAQNAADAAALAGAMAECSGGNATTAAEAYALSNKAVVTNQAYTLSNGYVVTNTVSVLSGDTNFAHYVQVVVHDVYKPTFASLLWKGTLNITGSAKAGCKTTMAGPPVIVLDPTDCQSFFMNGNTETFTVNNGTVQVDLSCQTGNGQNAAFINGNYISLLTATPAMVVGTTFINGNGNSITPHQHDLATYEPDPLANLAAPTGSGCAIQANPAINSIGGTFNLSPGIYSNGLSVNGIGVTVNLQQGSGSCQGLYIIRSSTGLYVNGNSMTLNGSGVTIYIDSGANVLLNGNSMTTALTAPTSGTYADPVFPGKEQQQPRNAEREWGLLQLQRRDLLSKGPGADERQFERLQYCLRFVAAAHERQRPGADRQWLLGDWLGENRLCADVLNRKGHPRHEDLPIFSSIPGPQGKAS